jgi:hypothetical protein
LAKGRKDDAVRRLDRSLGHLSVLADPCDSGNGIGRTSAMVTAMVERLEVAHMGAVIADEVNALKEYATKIRNCAKAGDEQLWHNLDVMADSIVVLSSVVRKLEERVTALEA